MLKKCITFFLPLLWGCIGVAQNANLQVSMPGIGGNGFIRFNDDSGLMNKAGQPLEYSDVTGECFWDKQWRPAILILKGGNGVKLKRVRLNFYTSNVHYIDKNGNELTTIKGLVNRIVFYDREDTTKLSAVFKSYAGFNNSQSYIQILNEGKVQLCKVNDVTLKKKNYDPMVGRDEFKFVSLVKYFINDNGVMTQLKGFRKSNVQSIIPSTPEIESWLSANNNKLKNEDEVLSFLEFYNSSKK